MDLLVCLGTIPTSSFDKQTIEGSGEFSLLLGCIEPR